MPSSEDEFRHHNFLTKALERLNNSIIKFRCPKLDNWDCWKQDWITAITNSDHPSADTEGQKLFIIEALKGEVAIQGQQVVLGWKNYTADKMFKQLDSIFMPKQESHLARLEFRQHCQHPNEPALDYLANKRVLYNKGLPTNQDIFFLISEALKGLCSFQVKRDLYKEVFTTCEQLQD